MCQVGFFGIRPAETRPAVLDNFILSPPKVTGDPASAETAVSGAFGSRGAAAASGDAARGSDGQGVTQCSSTPHSPGAPGSVHTWRTIR